MNLKKLILFCLLAGILFQNTEAFAMGTANAESGNSVVAEQNNKEKSEKKIVGYKYVYKTVKEKKKKKVYAGKYLITYYCACKLCCGKDDGITASGVKAKAGRTIAMDISVPFGTKVKIGNKDGYVVEDRGGAIKGKHIDVFCSSHKLALKKGKHYKKVWIEKEVTVTKRKKVKVPIYE